MSDLRNAMVEAGIASKKQLSIAEEITYLRKSIASLDEVKSIRYQEKLAKLEGGE